MGIEKMSAAFIFLFALLLAGCDKNEFDPDASPNALEGAGVYNFSDYSPLNDKSLDVYYYIPTTATQNSKILISLHGNGRNAQELRSALEDKADLLNFIVVAPEFSQTDFPGGDAYNLGNIFEDGDNPEPSELNPEEAWSLSIIEPLFQDFLERSENQNTTYDIFGHSAGGQFVHRFLIYKEDVSVNRLVCAASGWYTVPDNNIEFPYGLANSPAAGTSPERYFGSSLTMLIGENDTDPNSFNLRHNEETDAQGLNRLERAQHFYDTSQEIALQGGFDSDLLY
ncbi:MAG: hypothetical protein LC664_06735 [Flavobacteriales bacterium]|nr:hypothetical protein [Flavobacteriales bacterium]